MSEVPRAVVIEKVLASRGWFDKAEYDLSLREEGMVLARTPAGTRANRLERGVIRHGVSIENLGRVESEKDCITIPYGTIETVRLFSSAIQPNMTYHRIGLFVEYRTANGKMAKIWISVSGLRYQLEREAAERMPRKDSECILRRNQFLAEYAHIIKEILEGLLPTEVLNAAEWDIPELTYEIPKPDLGIRR